MRGLRKEAQEEARRGEGRKAAPESQGGEEGLEESRKAGGKGQGRAGAKTEAKAQASGEAKAERRQGKRQAPERARRKSCRGPVDRCTTRDFRRACEHPGSGSQRFGLAGRRPPFSEFVMAGLVPAIHVFIAAILPRRGCPAQGRA